eukprot:6213632-Pleurochrysis_carterae.AAC.1
MHARRKLGDCPLLNRQHATLLVGAESQPPPAGTYLDAVGVGAAVALELGRAAAAATTRAR